MKTSRNPRPGRKQITNIWGWLNEITLYKTPADCFTDESWNCFNSYMIHRFVSMNVDYVELANYVQTIPYDNKIQTYNIYREMIPKKKVFLKYLKSKRKSPQPKLLEHLCSYFQCGQFTAARYLEVLKKKETLDILNKMGVDEKESKKLLKNG